MLNSIKSIEELFLKIFKVAVLVFMGLALLAIPVFIAIAGFQWFQSPQEPTPAQKAPLKEIQMEDLRKFLIEREKSEGTRDATPRQAMDRPMSLRFQEDATKLYRCAGEFGRQVGTLVEDINDAVNAQRLQELRIHIESTANGSKLRGEGWVAAVVSFACTALADPAIIALRKENKVKQVFYPIMQFHAHVWTANLQEKINFDQREIDRVASEKAAELARVAESKASAIASLTIAGGLFAAFMFLALYLLACKAENDLREINESIRVAGGQRAV